MKKKVSLKAHMDWILGIFVIFGLFLFFNYMGSLEYFQGREFHYAGTSNLTAVQSAQFVSDYPDVGYDSNISKFKLAEDGTVGVEYDLYSAKEWGFLEKREFSFFDSPIVGYTKELLSGEYFTSFPVLGIIVALVCFGIYTLFPNFTASVVRSIRLSAVKDGYSISSKKIQKIKAQAQYSPRITNEIDIKLTRKGVICNRTWAVKRGFLHSTGNGNLSWKSGVIFADQVPNEENQNGVYAVKLPECVGSEFLIGIVSITGEWLEHADMVVRGNCCEILHILLSKGLSDRAELISSYYGVPVTLCDDTRVSFYDWLISENGIECQRHNAKISKEVKCGNTSQSNTQREITVTGTQSGI
jgi:hypothetical protein